MRCRVCTIANEMERVKGIEPSSSAWEAAALPLSYTRSQSSAELQHAQKQVNLLLRARLENVPVEPWCPDGLESYEQVLHCRRE